MLLTQMQGLLARLYDAPIEHDVYEFLVTDRTLAARIGGQAENAFTDEQVFVAECDDELKLAVYIDATVLERLQRCDPLAALDEANLPDYCTALEGVSHFQYLVWSAAHARNVSLLELEVQAEVDKYASAVYLFTRQNDGRFPHRLHRRLFERVRFATHLDEESGRRYREANRHAAAFCRVLEERFLRIRHARPEAWLAALRCFYRCGHREKLRYATA
jgi:hypothetical protein